MPDATPANGFSWIDWSVVIGYLLVVVAVGVLCSRRSKREGNEFFLAGRSMPMWAVAISVLATSQSAATFVGGPMQSFKGDLTYLAASIAPLLASIIVAVLFLPAFYKHKVTSVYELLGASYGKMAQVTASCAFLIGRIFASGARLFMVAIPFSIVSFGDTSPSHLIASILIIALVATAYTIAGGIRAVIWTDVLQAIVYIGSVTIALLVLWNRIDLPAGEVLDILRHDNDGSKLTVIDTTWDLSKGYSIWAIVFGLTLFNLAALGTDQDLTQRMLTCKTARQSGWSVVLSQIIGWPIVFIFLLLGLGLYVLYQRPDVLGDAAPMYEIAGSSEVFIQFIVHEMPVGLRGLMIAGLFAAAMSSTDSALNAMSSSFVSDIYRPCRSRKGFDVDQNLHERRIARGMIVVWAITLAVFATICVDVYDPEETTLIDFALGVMVFAYSGLLAVFLTALLTRRGNSISSVAAMITGFVTVLIMRNSNVTDWLKTHDFVLAFPWQMLISTALSFFVCCAGHRK